MQLLSVVTLSFLLQVILNGFHAFILNHFFKGTPLLLLGTTRQMIAARQHIKAAGDQQSMEHYSMFMCRPGPHKVFKREVLQMELITAVPITCTVCSLTVSLDEVNMHSIICDLLPANEGNMCFTFFYWVVLNNHCISVL